MVSVYLCCIRYEERSNGKLHLKKSLAQISIYCFKENNKMAFTKEDCYANSCSEVKQLIDGFGCFGATITKVALCIPSVRAHIYQSDGITKLILLRSNYKCDDIVRFKTFKTF